MPEVIEVRYTVAATDIIDPGINSEEWSKAKTEALTFQPWKDFYQPINASFKLMSGPQGISILMHTDEKKLRSMEKKQNGAICTDSCMEFFFKPNPWDTSYINLEFNPSGILHIGIGSGRHSRRLLDTDRSIFSIESVANDGDWTLKFYLPFEFLYEHFETVSDVCKANFYKCGDMTDHPHYISWTNIETEKPDFHVPDFFGFLEIKNRG